MIANLDADTDLEKSVLSAVIDNPQSRAPYLGGLSGDCFADFRNRALWEMIEQVHRQDASWDLGMLSGVVKQRDSDMETGGILYLHCEVLKNEYWNTALNVRQHIRRLRELARERLQREIGQQMATGTISGNLTETLDQLRVPVWPEEENIKSGAGALAEEALDEWGRALALAKSGRAFAGLDCGFAGLNNLLNGLCPGLTVIAARPSIGKTTLALQMALQVAQDGVPVGFISLEMTRSQLGGKAGSILGDVDSSLQAKGALNEEDQERLANGLKHLARMPLQTWINERHIDAIAARIRQESHVKLWVVDHLHRIHGNGDSDHERYGNSAHVLADLAVEINAPILLISQLNRQCEERSDHRPQIGDLRGSGSIEEHAVNVLLIYRPGFYDSLRDKYKNDQPALDGLVRQALILGEKIRHAPVGVVPLAWVPDRGTFADLAPTYRREPTNYHPAEDWRNR